MKCNELICWKALKEMTDTNCQRCEIATFNWGQDPLARELFPALRFERVAHERSEQGGTADCGMADSDATWTAGTKEANEIMNWILNDLFGFGNFRKHPLHIAKIFCNVWLKNESSLHRMRYFVSSFPSELHCFLTTVVVFLVSSTACVWKTFFIGFEIAEHLDTSC